MNLGQLIDPERVQRGSPAPSPAKQAPAEPLGRMTHSSDQRAGGELFTPRARPAHPPGFSRQRVREVLAKASRALSTPEIFDLLIEHDLEVAQVNAATLALYDRLEVAREGIRGSYAMR
jgi:hypothetical protein